MEREFANPTAFRQATEQRLKNLAAEKTLPLSTLRLKFTIERLLARLFAVHNPPWLLKGGYAMELRYRPHARTTKDVDLSICDFGRDDIDSVSTDQIRDELQIAAETNLGDYLDYRILEARTELHGAPRGGARFPVEARMAGRIFGSFHVDVGIGDALIGTPERLLGEDLLAFAGIGPANVLAVPRAQQFAEKIHAYSFPWTNRPNTRSRDLVDLLLILERDPPEVQNIRQALSVTFAARRSHPLPQTLPAPPESWAGEFAAMANEIQLHTPDLNTAFATLSDFWRTHNLWQL